MYHRDDHKLVLRALSGEQPALTRVLERMRCIEHHLTGCMRPKSREGQDANSDDLTQEALLYAWQELETFRGEARLESWAFGIACKELARLIEPTEHGREVPLESIEREPPPCTCRDLEMIDALEAFEGQVARLDSRSARVLRMKLVHDLSFAEIAEQLGISLSGAKSTYYRGLQELRERSAC